MEATLPISKASSLLEIVHLHYAYITIRYMCGGLNAQDKPSSGRAGLDIADVNRCNRTDRAGPEWLVLLPRRGLPRRGWLVVLLGRDRRVGSGPWDAACD